MHNSSARWEFELTSCGIGWCETRRTGSPSLRQQHGFIHAGALMTLADHSCGGAAASTVPEDRDVITVENKVSFLRPASGPDLICRAEVLRAGRNLVFVEAEVMVQGEEGSVMVAKHPVPSLSFLLTRNPPERLPHQTSEMCGFC